MREPSENGQQQQAPAGYVDIELWAVSLNAKDIYAMNGRLKNREKTTGLYFSGVVTSVGAGVDGSLKVGDHVVAYAPSISTRLCASPPAACIDCWTMKSPPSCPRCCLPTSLPCMLSTTERIACR